MRRKTKIYLDTSVISHLDAEDVPEKMRLTREFWEKVKLGLEFDVYISAVTERELYDCPEPKRSLMTKALQEIGCTLLHLVNFKTIDRVNATNLSCGYQFIQILSPKMEWKGD